MGQQAAGAAEDFPSCYVYVGKATSAVLLGTDGRARLRARQQLLKAVAHPCLVTLKAGVASLDLCSSSPFSSFFLSTDGLASPRIFVLVAAKFNCATQLSSFVLVRVLIPLLFKLHIHCKTAYTNQVQHPTSRKAQSLLQTGVM